MFGSRKEEEASYRSSESNYSSEEPARRSGKTKATHGIDNSAVQSEARKKRRTSARAYYKADTSIPHALSELQEDVVDDRIQYSSVNVIGPHIPHASSQLVAKVYVQQKNGFTAKSRDKAFKTSTSEMQDKLFSTNITPLKMALCFQTCFKHIANFCHGLLAGLAFWQCIMVYQLSSYGRGETMDFVQHYYNMARPFQTTFYFLTVVCLVSVLDRYDLIHLNLRHIGDLLLYQSSCLVILVYAATLILTLYIVREDDKLALYEYKKTLWFPKTNKQGMRIELNYWRNLNLGRCIGAIVGWIMFALSPTIDMLYLHLEFLQKYQPRAKQPRHA